MPIRFGEDSRQPTFDVLQFRPGDSHTLIAGSDRSFDRSTLLHWLPDHKRGVPCLHEDCPWCPSPTRSVTYVPVLAVSGTRWLHKVLGVQDGMRVFLEEERAMKVYRFGRVGARNAPVRWQWVIDGIIKPIPFEGFDVTASLYRLWGMFADMKRRLQINDLGLFDGVDPMPGSNDAGVG